MAALAAEAGCDRTYIAQVLSGKAHLTPDHVLGLADAFSLNEAEAEFFLLLMLSERSSSTNAKKRLANRLERLQQNNMAVSAQVEQSDKPVELSDNFKLRYYSSWKYSAIHILTSIKTFQRVNDLADKIRMEPEEIRSIADELVKHGLLISKQNDRYEHSGANLHVPASSPLNTMNHLNWRMQAMEKVDQRNSVHYTDVFSISTDDEPKLKAMILSFVERFRKQVKSSGADTALALTLDFFKV